MHVIKKPNILQAVTNFRKIYLKFDPTLVFAANDKK